jgi:hypothetical protein
MPTKCSIVERQKGKDLGCDPALYSSSCMLCRLDYEMVETFSIEQPSELSRSAQCPQNDTPPLSLARIQRVGGTPNKERGDGSARQPIDTRTDSSARGAPSILTMAKIAGCSKHKALSTVLVQLLTSLFVDALEANKQQICRIVMGCYRGLVVLPWVLTGLMCGTTLAQGTSVVTEAAAQALLRETQEFLVGGHAALEDDSQLSGAMEDIQREIESLHAVQQDLERKEREIDRLVALANAKQVEGLIARLSETLSKEMALRSLTGQSGEGMATADVVTAEYVDRQELQEQLGAQRFLAASEFVISDWVRQILKAELKEYKTSMLELANNSAVSSRSSTGEGCAAVTDVVQDIQVALTKFSQDVIGLVDHAQGAEIVHTMTSPTYVPPPTENELLGNVWWSKFIPEDWERLLPEGWEDWDIRIPSFFFHSLVRCSLVSVAWLLREFVSFFFLSSALESKRGKYFSTRINFGKEGASGGLLAHGRRQGSSNDPSALLDQSGIVQFRSRLVGHCAG